MEKINIGELTVNEFNLIMKQLASGQLGECIDLFMKLKNIAEQYANKNNAVSLPPPLHNQRFPVDANVATQNTPKP